MTLSLPSAGRIGSGGSRRKIRGDRDPYQIQSRRGEARKQDLCRLAGYGRRHGGAYLPIADRVASLREIDVAMHRIARAIGRGIPGARVSTVMLPDEKCCNKLIVNAGGVQIKIEVTPVPRGYVHEPSVRHVSARVEDEFGYAEIQVVSFADLYAGKIVAALDRQHPRDWFDVRDLLANEGIEEELRKAFVVYLLSHNRPMAEVMAPARLDIEAELNRGFAGMTETPVTVHELLRTRETLVTEIAGGIPEKHRHFLMSVKRTQLGAPRCSRRGSTAGGSVAA